TALAPVYYRPFLRLADGTFVTDFEPPEPDVPFWFTHVNSRGDIAGGYYSWDEGRYMGFVRDKHGAYTSIEVPGLQHNELYSINASGTVVGTAWNPNTAFIAIPRHLDTP
ncbi:MAG TPA: hypothetical protein VE173_01465, partial [Longimicrobiales bacterium]|nr:hypothetical protein [Longimicrobiales bacterium]